MTFKDLLEQFSFDEIAPAFKTLWQRNAPEQAARLDMEGWRKIYHSIQKIKPVHSLYYIRLGDRWEGCVELVAGLLWEIAYYGGTEVMSNENQKRIFNRNKNANE